MSEARCEQTELLVTDCAHCRPAPDGPEWDAKFEGVCKVSTCLAVIDVGERVKWNREGTDVIHARHKDH